MSASKDLTGLVFGRWTVGKRSANNVHGQLTWTCLCECGNQRVVSGYCLRGGQSRSCGCLKVEQMRKVKGGAGFNSYMSSLLNGAKKRGLEVTISREQIHAFTRMPCHYCGAELTAVFRPNSRSQSAVEHASFRYNGIDRVDSSRGYVSGNCVACCKFCNQLKSSLSMADFLARIAKIYNHSIVDRAMNRPLMAQLLTEKAGRAS